MQRARMFLFPVLLLFLAGCAAVTNSSLGRNCSPSHRETVVKVFEAMSEFSLASLQVMKSLVADGATLLEVLGDGNDEKKGKEFARELRTIQKPDKYDVAITFSLGAMQDTDEHDRKLITINREDEYYDPVKEKEVAVYRHVWLTRVQFNPGHCIIAVEKLKVTWQKIQ